MDGRTDEWVHTYRKQYGMVWLSQTVSQAPIGIVSVLVTGVGRCHHGVSAAQYVQCLYPSRQDVLSEIHAHVLVQRVQHIYGGVRVHAHVSVLARTRRLVRARVLPAVLF